MSRKLPREIENPIDNMIVDFCDKLNPYMKEINIIPNHLTTLALICTCISFYYIYYDNFTLGALFFGIAYIFDCMDGNYARKYDMVTEFGDWYDHLVDL